MIYWYCKDTSAYLPEIGQIRHFFKERNGNLTRRTVQEEQARLRKQRKKAQGFVSIFKKPLHESLTSVLPIMLIVLALGFTIAPVPNNAMVAFLLGGVMLIAGMGLFTLGSEMSMIPLGQAVGSEITRSKNVWIIVGIIFLIGLSVCYWSESQGNPALQEIGVSQSMGSMEGKEVRFGIAQSAMFTTTTTSFTTGTVNNMHDTLTPLGGMIPLLHMMLNVVFGGKGVGLMNMIMYAILAVFICGLMIGRTPEYLGKKIEGREMKLTALCIIIHPFLILFFSALAVSTSGGLEGITNPGFHGLSQVLYEYASSAANNGSGFEGLADNSYFWNITAGLAMFFGRYLSIVIQLAIAGSLMRKRFVNETVGTLRTDTLSFAVILVFVVYIFAALTFFPALALGPIAEHLTLWA